MKIIGITGGIGAGKSMILEILKREYDAYVVETDRLAQRLMEPGEGLYDQLFHMFSDVLRSRGEESLIREQLVMQNGEWNRSFLARLIFSDPDILRQMNALVHPAVKAYILSDIKNQTVPLYIIESAILIEDGYDRICDELWYIYADTDTRINRLMNSRQYSYEKCLQIMNSQASEDYYREHTLHTIDNTGDIDQVREQIHMILNTNS